MSLTLHGRHYATGEPITVLTRGDRIHEVVPAWPQGSVEAWPWIAPGLFDLQINGHGGVWFPDPNLTPAQVSKAVFAYRRFGVTRLCPTLITSSFEALAAGLAAIRQACEADPSLNRMVPGCHLEGPHLSGVDGPRGAHPLEHIRPADWSEFERLQEIAGGRVRLVTIAPEVDGAIDFIRRATAAGVVIAIGHTAATSEQIAAAVDAGARLSTHLGNGCTATVHRHHNHLWPQLADPRLSASLIVDGHHLPAEFVRACVLAKGTRGIILTCDASGWAGCPPGLYESHLGRCEVLESGKLVVAGQRELLAGSAFETDVCLLKVREFTGVGWKEAIDMTSRNPAKLLRFEPARLRRGSLADLFVFRATPGIERIEVAATISGGEIVHGSVWTEMSA